MCYETNARPPLPPIAGGAGIAGTTDLTLRSADGTEFSAYSARTAQADAPGMVILPDVRGLHPFYEDLADRFASAGVHATAFDYFGRTAGLGPRDDDFEYMPHVQQTTPDAIAADVAATAAHVRSPDGGGATSLFTVGFCFGGRASFNQAARGHGLAGVIGFYGRVAPSDEQDTNAPASRVGEFKCPVLGLFGGADQGIPTEDVDAFRAALDAAGVRNEIVSYEDAPHSFFDRRFEEHKDACDDAWRRILGFVGVA
ncbi:MAG TPA: dienelactone hydrolase family protein [Actinomycetota bacterium]